MFRWRTLLMLLALVQATVSSLTAGVNYWTGGGPERGEVAFFAFAPSEPSTVYAVAIGQALLNSTDAGTTWRAIYKGGVRYFEQSLVVLRVTLLLSTPPMPTKVF